MRYVCRHHTMCCCSLAESGQYDFARLFGLFQNVDSCDRHWAEMCNMKMNNYMFRMAAHNSGNYGKH